MVGEDVRTNHTLVGNRGHGPGRVVAASCAATQAPQGLCLCDSGLRLSAVLRHCWPLAWHELRGKHARFPLFAVSLYLRLPAGCMECVRPDGRSNWQASDDCDAAIDFRGGSYLRIRIAA